MLKDTGNKKNEGFTIVEVIVSIAIISILLIAGMYILSGSLTTIANKGEDTRLLYEAQEAMEKLVSGTIVDVSSYPNLYLLKDSSATLPMEGPGGVVVNIPGTLYIIYENGTSNEILKSFVPVSTS
ncbi:prepilin-type N-terminal cleavage/methylation domain-containing protein [Alkalibacter saccharofermentans]|uniref:Prepilin-type N-terminal cleavage/methylation domain-containing protein n=1 Tax=Alkalibacter saccharofermentans DSM 14828 TaxID=1120975 RepID=A0A1M4S924_9FIRM|nr:prepilin-type N-terminal cleavage/methylation domain-containing protein [Alkalibacter saccharofermentans]SHE28665.1 prepilin-type N-terminal cleavage/methylation domain-containing protein [Alkalibacter saccharofermentans DSM 14828]